MVGNNQEIPTNDPAASMTVGHVLFTSGQVVRRRSRRALLGLGACEACNISASLCLTSIEGGGMEAYPNPSSS